MLGVGTLHRLLEIDPEVIDLTFFECTIVVLHTESMTLYSPWKEFAISITPEIGPSCHYTLTFSKDKLHLQSKRPE